MALTADRPDFTFLLPRGLKVNLDAKFPLDNYLAYYQAKTEEEKRACQKRFLADVRKRVKEVIAKGYRSPQENTVDLVLVFIPNEQVFSFINVYDPALFEDAMRNKVVLCSPWTLYPVLSIIRIAIDNFVLEKASAALLPLLGNFDKQWEAFNEALEKMGKKIAEAQKEHEQLVGTRHRQLDKVLAQMDALRQQTEFHAVDGDGRAKR
jgi:DNA recombination protein RmuC